MLVPSIFGENLWDDFFGYPDRNFTIHSGNTNGLMKTDIKESDAGYELEVALPGVKKEDIEIELKDGYLNVSASSASNKDEEDKEKNYIRRERYYGSASRSFYVGEDLEQDDIKASYQDGILKLDVPKVEKKPKVEEKVLIPIAE